MIKTGYTSQIRSLSSTKPTPSVILSLCQQLCHNYDVLEALLANICTLYIFFCECISPVLPVPFTLPVPLLDLVPRESSLQFAPMWILHYRVNLHEYRNYWSLIFIEKHLLVPLVFLFCSGHRSWSARSGKKKKKGRETPFAADILKSELW